jgi:hypothetical protein
MVPLTPQRLGQKPLPPSLPAFPARMNLASVSPPLSPLPQLMLLPAAELIPPLREPEPLPVPRAPALPLTLRRVSQLAVVRLSSWQASLLLPCYKHPLSGNRPGPGVCIVGHFFASFWRELSGIGVGPCRVCQPCCVSFDFFLLSHNQGRYASFFSHCNLMITESEIIRDRCTTVISRIDNNYDPIANLKIISLQVVSNPGKTETE